MATKKSTKKPGKKTRGRPPREGGRMEMVFCRLAPADREKVEVAAAKAGVSVSQFIRAAAVEKAG